MAKNCRVEIGKALSKLKLSDEELDEIYKEATDIIQKANASGREATEVLNEAVNTYVKKIETNKAQARLSKAKYDGISEHMAQTDLQGDGYKGLMSAIRTGESGKFKGMGASLEQQARTIKNKFGQIVQYEILDKPGMLKRLQTGQDDLTLRKLLMGMDVEADVDLKGVAKSLKKMQDLMYTEKRKAGFDIAYLEDRVVKQTHSAKGMREMKFEGWSKAAKESFDFEAMGWRADEVELRLSKMYDKNTNKTNKSFWSVDDEFKQVTVNSLGNRLEKGRVVKFKTPEAAHAYNQMVNGTTMFEDILKEVEFDSGQIAAAQKFGPNYRSTYKKLKDDVLNSQELSTIQIRNLDASFEHAIRPGREAGNSIWSSIGDKSRKLKDMAVLGKALISTMTDFAYGAGTVSQITGRNFLGEQGRVISEFMKAVPPANRKQIAKQLNVFAEDVISMQQNSRLGETGSNHSFFDRMHNLYMKATGLSQQSLAMRVAVAKQTSSAFAEMGDKTFDNLYSGSQNALRKFGIEGKEWDTIRKLQDDFGDGTRGITAEAIQEAGHGKLADDWSGFLTWAAENGSPTAGLKHSVWKYHLDPDTWYGQMGLMVGQYKSFTVATFDTMYDIGTMSDSKLMNAKALGATAASATALGYMALVAKDFVSGKEDIDKRRDPTKFGTWKDAFVQGGAGLIYGDMLLQEYDSFGSKFTGNLAPAFSTFDDMAAVISAAGQTLDPTAKSYQSAKARQKLAKRLMDAVEKNSPAIPMTKALINKNVFEALRKATNTQKKNRSDNRFRPKSLER